ncbi:hypothetical protein EES43_20395 [Streptomyces sp. ADI96-02]|uniref:SH3 domain-containing protein n=1 Tax=unclassified Streptomyces TaxID=2593676 RepID=UPI000F553622|nr:SH3 domain-containing protein [Streptomyces sp. ADI96-02]RPK58015.1 hypothetical protein EES43_20395 [Streptomyces sp. ADI96-02]
MSPLSRPSRLRRIGLCVATGALAAFTAVSPALAADPQPVGPAADQQAEAAAPDPSPENLSASEMQREHEARLEAEAQGQTDAQAERREYRGRVVADPYLYLRDRPTRSSRIVGKVWKGEYVSIFCKVDSDDVVDGNPRWYLLTDGTWAWGSARYIENIGRAPRFC